MVWLASRVPILAELLQQYYEPAEFKGVAKLFSIEFSDLFSSSTKEDWLEVARQVVEQAGNR